MGKNRQAGQAAAAAAATLIAIVIIADCTFNEVAYKVDDKLQVDQLTADQLISEGKAKVDETQTPSLTRADLDEALLSLPSDYTDAEYVVDGMRRHFGDLFTADDEAKVRELVKPNGALAEAGSIKARILVACTIGGIDFKPDDLLIGSQAVIDHAVKHGQADDSEPALLYVEQLHNPSDGVLE